jgi:hypothetical protein
MLGIPQIDGRLFDRQWDLRAVLWRAQTCAVGCGGREVAEGCLGRG